MSPEVLANHRHRHDTLLEWLKELESSNMAALGEYSQLLAVLKVHQVELLVKPLSNEELVVEALKEAKQILDSQVADLNTQLGDVVSMALLL